LCYLRNELAPENTPGRDLTNPALLDDSLLAAWTRLKTEPYVGGGVEAETQRTQHKTGDWNLQDWKISVIPSEFMRKNFINRMLFNDDIDC